MKMIDNRLVYAVKYLFADFSDLRFSWIYKAASRVVSKVGFVIFKASRLAVVLNLSSRWSFLAISWALSSIEFMTFG